MIEELPRIKFPEKGSTLREEKQAEEDTLEVTSKRGAKDMNFQNRRNPDSPMKPIR